MASIVYTSGVVIGSTWLNDVNTVAYTYFGNGVNLNANVTLNAPTGVGFLSVNGTVLYKWDGAKFSPNNPQVNTLDLGASTFPFKTGYFGTSVVTPLIGTDTSVDLQLKANGVTRWNVLQGAVSGMSAGSLYPQSDNALDIGASTFQVRTGRFGTSVVTPLVTNASGNLEIKESSNTSRWVLVASDGSFQPNAGDNTQNIGAPAGRIKTVFTPIIDSGTTGSLSLKTNSGTTQFSIDHAATAVNFLHVVGGAAASDPILYARGSDTNVNLHYDTQAAGSHIFSTNSTAQIQFQISHTTSAVNRIGVTGASTGNDPSFVPAGSDTNVGMRYFTQGSGTHSFITGSSGTNIQFQVAHTASAVNRFQATGGTAGNAAALLATGEAGVSAVFGTIGTGSILMRTDGVVTQGEFLRVASATRWITFAGSNGGNPTIGVTGGSLAITPNVVIAGNLNVGNSNATPGSTEIVFGSNGAAILRVRNSANNGDVIPVQVATQVAADIVNIGAGSCNGTYVKARSGGAAPTTTDLPAGFFTVWRDTGGATTKLYYNNAGTIQSVALA